LAQLGKEFSLRGAFMQKRQWLEQLIQVGRGEKKADLVLKGARRLDVFTGKWRDGDIAIYDGVVAGVDESYSGKKTLNLKGKYLVPGFIDAHVHIESTMMTPSQFEKAVFLRGTTGAIVDPHEIANVLGIEGIKYFLDCSEDLTMDMYVMLSSCVPATTDFETSGAKLKIKDLLPFKSQNTVLGLAEMMNYPGVLNRDKEVIEKLLAFEDSMIDGHCPMLSGKDLNAYIAAGIKTCHESTTAEEAEEKISKGMYVLAREGTVAKNLKALLPAINDYSSSFVSLCTDDRNPADIMDEGHIDHLIRMVIENGVKPEVAYRTASLSPARAYGLWHKGAIAPGFDADLVILKNYKRVMIDSVVKDGVHFSVASDLPEAKVKPPKQNTIRLKKPVVDDIKLKSDGGKYRVIQVVPEQILTNHLSAEMKAKKGEIVRDLKRDILKICVWERHGHNRPVSVGLVKGFGLKKGAIASSVGHDSHNIVAVGADDEDIISCVEWIMEKGGGFVVSTGGKVTEGLALPVAGLMSDAPLGDVYKKIKRLRSAVRSNGCPLEEPFLQLAFLSLPVIPSLKITDKGLVDVDKFQMVDLRF
jgi:adenine deaminase